MFKISFHAVQRAALISASDDVALQCSAIAASSTTQAREARTPCEGPRRPAPCPHQPLARWDGSSPSTHGLADRRQREANVISTGETLAVDRRDAEIDVLAETLRVPGAAIRSSCRHSARIFYDDLHE